MLWFVRSSLKPSQILRRPFSLSRPLQTTQNGSQSVPWSTSVPSFRQQVARNSELPSFTEKVKRPSIRNQVVFCIVGSVVAFGVAARLTNEVTYEWSERLCKSAPAWKHRPPTNDEMRRARYYSLGKTLQQQLVTMKEATDNWPQAVKGILVWAYIQVAQPVLDTAETRRWNWIIGSVGSLAYIAWQSPRSKLFISKHFMHSPLSGLSYTMFTSMFAYKSLPHLLLACMVLAPFGSAAAQHLNERQTKGRPDNLREATPKWHFLAFFISAGLFSNLVSHIALTRFIYPRMIARLRASLASAPPLKSSAPAASSPSPLARFFSTTRWSSTAQSSAAQASARASTIPITMGASGAVYATITLVSLGFPDTDIAFKIPPTFPIEMAMVVPVLGSLDILGVWNGWRLFNHWAHLGGIAYGWLYWTYGPELWNIWRELTLGSLPPSLCNLKPDTED